VCKEEGQLHGAQVRCGAELVEMALATRAVYRPQVFIAWLHMKSWRSHVSPAGLSGYAVVDPLGVLRITHDESPRQARACATPIPEPPGPPGPRRGPARHNEDSRDGRGGNSPCGEIRVARDDLAPARQGAGD
jgi:hypothetical protein